MNVMISKCTKTTDKASFFEFKGTFQGSEVYGVMLKNCGHSFEVGSSYVVSFNNTRLGNIILEGDAVKVKEFNI